MKSAKTTVIRWALMAILLGTAGKGWAQDGSDRRVAIFHGSLTNDVRRLFGEDRPAQAMLGYTQEKHIPLSNLVAVLEWFVNDGIGVEARAETVWSIQAINVIGNLRRPECLPRLVEIAQHPPNRPCRSSAVRAISRIGGRDALTFAATVVADTNNFSLSDRLHLYEVTMRHAVSGVLEFGSVTEPSAEEQELTRAFFFQEPGSAEKLESVLRYDAHVSSMLAAYRTNAARVALLVYFSTNAPAPFRQRFAQRLDSFLQREPPTLPPRPVGTNLNETQTLSVSPSVNTGSCLSSISPTDCSAYSLSRPLETVSPQRRALFWALILSVLVCCAGVVMWYMRYRKASGVPSGQALPGRPEK